MCIRIFILLSLQAACIWAEPDSLLTALTQNSLRAYDLMRNDIGVYADNGTFSGNSKQGLGSCASVGMGLVSLCIADALKYDPQAEAKVVKTLQALTGETSGFTPPVNHANGFFRHFFDMTTGAGSGEFSSIDTGILAAGALFCKTYFASNPTIAALADGLYRSVKWTDAIANPATGDLYMIMDSIPSAITRPFNEYMLVAWLAKNSVSADTASIQSWNNSYGKPAGLPHISYGNLDLLTDQPANYLPNFAVQFAFYLVHPFIADSTYLRFFQNHMQADRLWFQNRGNAPAYFWGTGAGANVTGYSADNFNSNPYATVSPHILAGFLPVDPNGVWSDIKLLWASGKGRYTFADGGPMVLWRFSLVNQDWRAGSLQGVDFSTMVFGLASHPDMLGKKWFETYNDFSFPKTSDAVRMIKGHGDRMVVTLKGYKVDGRLDPFYNAPSLSAARKGF